MTRAQLAVAVGAIVLALASAALMVEAGRRVYRTLGPSHAIAAGDGSLYVVSHGKIHVFAPGGERLAAIDLAALGAATKPSDIALHADGRIVLVDPDTSMLQRCTLPRGPCDSLDLGLAHADLQQVMPLNAAKLAIDEAARRYYVSDNAGQRLVIADFSGHVLGTSAKGTVWYPNHLFVSAPGELSVVDTNHQRIATFDVSADGVGRLLGEVEAGASGVTRPGREWPFDSAPMPDGETAVLIARNHMRDADVIVLDRNGKAARRVDLGPDSDPFDIERWGDRLVVADGTRYTLQALDFAGHAVAGFPPPVFIEELAREHDRARDWRYAQLGARIALIAVPLVAILILWRLGVTLVAATPTPADSVRVDGGTTWIIHGSAFMERQRHQAAWAMWIVIPAVLLVLGLALWAFSSAIFTRWGLHNVAPLLGLLALYPFLVLRIVRDAVRRRSSFRMGASAEGLRVVAADVLGRIREGALVPWSGVYRDPTRLLVGRSLVLLRDPIRGGMFDEQALSEAVLARVPPENVLTPFQLTARLIRARPRETLAAVLVFLVVLAILVAQYLRPL